MIPTAECQCRLIEHRLRVAGANRLGPHLTDLDLRQRRRGREVARGRLRWRLGAALVAVGSRLHGAQRTASPAAVAGPEGGGR